MNDWFNGNSYTVEKKRKDEQISWMIDGGAGRA